MCKINALNVDSLVAKMKELRAQYGSSCPLTEHSVDSDVQPMARSFAQC